MTPNLNHCIECDKPTLMPDGLCNKCHSNLEYGKEYTFKADKYNEIQELIIDLGWETQRMSNSGIETWNILKKIFDIKEEGTHEK